MRTDSRAHVKVDLGIASSLRIAISHNYIQKTWVVITYVFITNNVSLLCFGTLYLIQARHMSLNKPAKRMPIIAAPADSCMCACFQGQSSSSSGSAWILVGLPFRANEISTNFLSGSICLSNKICDWRHWLVQYRSLIADGKGRENLAGITNIRCIQP